MHHQMHSEVRENLTVDLTNPVRSIDDDMAIHNDHACFRITRTGEAID